MTPFVPPMAPNGPHGALWNPKGHIQASIDLYRPLLSSPYSPLRVSYVPLMGSPDFPLLTHSDPLMALMYNVYE